MREVVTEVAASTANIELSLWEAARTRGRKDEYEDNGGREHSRMGRISAVLLLLLVGASRF